MKHFFLKFFERIEQAPLTLASFATAFVALILVKLSVEGALEWFGEESLTFFFFQFNHTFLFFLCSFLTLIPVVRFAGAKTISSAANFLLFGFLLIVTPPIFDRLIFGKESYWSFYEFDGLLGLVQRFFTLFGDSPDIGITYGVRIEVVLVTIALGFYTYLKSERIGKALIVSLLTYTVLFVFGTFPSWVALLVFSFEKSLLAVTSADVAALFLTPGHVLGRELTDFRTVLSTKGTLVYIAVSVTLVNILLFRQYPHYFFALIKNARLPQLLYHAGLLFLGMILAVSFTDGQFKLSFFYILGALALLMGTWSAWIASVIVNDLYDTKIDAITNPNRPLIQNTIPRELYCTFGALFFFASLLFAGAVNFSAAMLLFIYQALAWLYSAPPLRLKQYPGLATLIAAFAGILVLIAGFVTIAPAHDIKALPLSILAYLFVAYFLVLPIKDFKDIAGDKKDGVYTIPVLLGASLGKQVIGSFLFLLFAMSPQILHMKSLLLPALIFGTLAFFTLQKGTDNETSPFAYRKLPLLIILITLGYGLTLFVALVN